VWRLARVEMSSWPFRPRERRRLSAKHIVRTRPFRAQTPTFAQTQNQPSLVLVLKGSPRVQCRERFLRTRQLL
jgi:hypothetical protein